MYAIYSTPYLDKVKKTYYNILIIEPKPIGNIQDIAKQIQLPNLTHNNSLYNSQLYNCVHAIKSKKDPFKLMDIDEIPTLFNYLTQNGYKINSEITNMIHNGNIQQEMRSLLCFIQIL